MVSLAQRQLPLHAESFVCASSPDSSILPTRYFYLVLITP